MVTTVHKFDSHLFQHEPARQFPIFEPNKKSLFERNMELFRKNVDSFTPPNLLVCSGQFGLVFIVSIVAIDRFKYYIQVRTSY